MRTRAATLASPALAAAVALAGIPAAADLPFRVVNDSKLTLIEFYASPLGEDAWSEDLLHVHVLRSGDTSSFPLAGNGQCDYDLRFILEDGRDLLDSVDVCTLPMYRLEDAQ